MSRTKDIIDLFRFRFVNRQDCYPLQYRSEGGGYTVVREELTDDVILAHLRGERTIGLYSSPESTTKWLCIDVDDLEEEAVREVQNHVRRFQLPYLTEFSGKKGYHVWVFFDKPYPNDVARALSRAFAFTHEVFPKQDKLHPGKLGNLVKAPLGVHQATGNWCLFLDADLIPYKNQYEVLERISCIDALDALKINLPELLPSVGPEKAEGTATTDRPSIVEIPVLKDCVRNAIMEGTRKGDRNRVGHVIASEFRRLGLERDQAGIILSSFWNSRNEEPLNDAEIHNILSSAYDVEQYVYGCKEGSSLRTLLNCVGYDECRFMKMLKSSARKSR